MSTDFWGGLSAVIVAASAVPYIIGIVRGTIVPSIVSWGLWTVIGLAILLTYSGAGATDNIWPAVFGVVNPCLVVILTLVRHRGKPEPFTTFEWTAAAICACALVGWLIYRDNPEMLAWALVLTIIADIAAAGPTLLYVWGNPDKERPGAWLMFATAYAVSMFAIEDKSAWSNYVLPIYMMIGAGAITLPMVVHLLRHRVPLRSWFF